MEKTPEELPGQVRESGTLSLSMGMRIVERKSNSFSSIGSWVGIHQALSTIMLATESFSKKWNLEAIGLDYPIVKPETNRPTISKEALTTLLKIREMRHDLLPYTRAVPYGSLDSKTKGP